MIMRTSLDEEEIKALKELRLPVLEGKPGDEVKPWLNSIEQACIALSIPKELYPVVARHYLRSGPRRYIKQCEKSLAALSKDFRWNWDAFQVAMIAMDLEAPDSTNNDQHKNPLGKGWEETNKFIREHPKAARATGAILIAASATVIIPAASVGVLGMIGFSAAGPVAGSLAAAIQSAVYGGAVGAGSAFALAQSAAMGGIAVASGGVQAVAVAATAAGAWFGFGSRKREVERTARL